MVKTELIRPSVILVADRTLSAKYDIMFEGIFGTMQTTQVPELGMKLLVSPPLKSDSRGRAKVAPLGLRRIESCLLAETNLDKEDVACVTPEMLPQVLGPWVKIVAITSSDPLGKGMSNTTTTGFMNGELYTKVWMNRLMKVIKDAKEKHGFKVIGGGAGAWQWLQNEEERESHGVDIVFEGYFEALGPQLFEDILEGKSVETHVREPQSVVSKIKPILGASMLGVMEISRGCGKACQFCTLAFKKMEHLNHDIILSDMQTNVDGGIRSVVSGSEDFFRYGATGGFRTDFGKLRELLLAMKEIDGLRFMQIDHANISSVLQLTIEELKEARRLLTWDSPTDYLWVNMGVESANGFLVHANGKGKMAPFEPDNWEEMVKEAARKMTEAGFFSVFSVILGLPGETPDDVQRTIKLVKYLSTQRAVVFPIFHEPVLLDHPMRGERFKIDCMRRDHLELYTTCYEINFNWVPKLYWDNQRAGGVAYWKRALIRILGKTEIITWRKNFSRERKKIKEREIELASVTEMVGS
jgi:radical SAM superfamily enzyme YgiQ (UPF0313 family)